MNVKLKRNVKRNAKREGAAYWTTLALIEDICIYSYIYMFIFYYLRTKKVSTITLNIPETKQ